MLKPRFNPKPKLFNYKARFYDAEKEALNERLAMYDKDGKDKSIESTKDNIRSSFRGGASPSDSKYRSKMVNRANLRVVVIVAILCLVLYMIMMSEQVLQILGEE